MHSANPEVIDTLICDPDGIEIKSAASQRMDQKSEVFSASFVGCEDAGF